MLVAPTGQLVVVGASRPLVGVPSHPPTLVGCPGDPGTAAAELTSLPDRCGPPSIVPAPGAQWSDIANWRATMPEATLLEAIPYDRRPAEKGTIRSPQGWDCRAAQEPAGLAPR
jgi:hypothetical protein